MPESFKDKDRRGALYFRAQVVELQVLMQNSDDLTMREGNGLTPLSTRAFLMNMLPHALAKAFSTYVTLNHGYYPATYFPEVLLDWIAASNQVICLITMINGNAIRRADLQSRVVDAPAMQFFCSLRTVKQIKLQVRNRYIFRTRKTVFQPLFEDSKPRNFFLGMVDDHGTYRDFPMQEDE